MDDEFVRLTSKKNPYLHNGNEPKTFKRNKKTETSLFHKAICPKVERT